MRERFQKTYKLLPDIMKKVDAEFGPLDWRLPYAHAIYWAYRGRQRCDEKSMIRHDRMIYQSVVLAFMKGRIVSNDSYETFATGPDLDFLPNVLKTFAAMVKKYPRIEGVSSAYESFLTRGILLLHDSNHAAESKSLYDLMCSNFPSKETAAGYEEFVAAVRADIISHQPQSAGK